MPEIGKLTVAIAADAAAFHTELSKVQQSLGGLQRTVNIASTVIAAAFMGIGVAAATMGLKFAADLEQAKIGFTTMLGSAMKADVYLRDMQEFAKRTPFEFPELLDASRRMIAFGFASEDVLPMLTDIGDAVAAMGAGGEAVQRVTYALGQMSTAGRVNAQDMMQLTSVGIKAWQYLADAAGKSVAEVRKLAEEGMLDSRVAIQVILAGMRKDFAGAMEAQSRTFLGLMSTLKDAARISLGRIMEPLLVAFKDAATYLESWTGQVAFDEWVENATAQLGKVVSFVRNDMIPAFGNLGMTLAKIDPDYITRIVQALAAFVALSATISVINTLAAALGSLATVVTTLGAPGVILALTVFTAAYVVMNEGLRTSIGLYEMAERGLISYEDALSETSAAARAEAAAIAAQTKQHGLFMNEIRAEEKDIENFYLAQYQAARASGRLNDSLVTTGKETKEATDKFREAGISIQDMARAYAEADPGVWMLGLRIVGLKDQLAGVNAALEANAAEQRAIQDAIAATRERISGLSSALSEAKARLADLANVRLVGMGKLDDQIFAIEQNIKRLQLVAAGGILPAGMAIPRGTIADLQAQLERLRLLREITFEPQMRALAAAAAPPAAEMTFAGAMAAIAATRAQIAGLEGQLSSANAVLASQESHLKAVQAAADDLRASAAGLQFQIDATTRTQQMMIDKIITAIVTVPGLIKAMQELGGEGIIQAGVLDKETKKLLKTFLDFSQEHSGTTIADVQAAGDAWQAQYDRILLIAAGIRGLTAGIGGVTVGGVWHGQHGGIAPGGLSLVGERGIELLNLPRGTTVTPLGGGGFAGAGHLTIEVPVYLDRERIAVAVWDSLKHKRLTGTNLGLA